MRLAKYAKRGFEILVPSLDRSRIDPNIYERPWGRLQGLPRLLVLEQLGAPSDRAKFNDGATKAFSFSDGRYGTDRLQERIEKLGGSAEESDYSTVFLPWGPGIKASNIARTMLKKDRKLNSSYFTYKRPYFLHPCFIGTAEDIVGDCSPDDPELPESVDPETVKNYVRGPLTWIQDDPGRQQIGSFNPTTTGDWEEGTYFLETTEKVCVAANQDDARSLEVLFASQEDGESRKKIANWRDFFGRCPLHLAVMARSTKSVECLLRNGARPEYRLPDGRSALHLCSQYGSPPELVNLLFEKGKELEENESKKGDKADKMEVDSKEDDEDAEETTPGEDDQKSSENEHKPFCMEEFVNNKGYGKQKQMSPLAFAILCNRPDLAKILLANGANVTEKVVLSDRKLPPLMLVRDDNAQEMVPVLINGGANPNSFIGIFTNVYHLCAQYGRNKLLQAILETESAKNKDRMAKALATIGCKGGTQNLCTPFTIAVEQGNLDGAKLLVKHGAKPSPDQKACDQARVRATNFRKKNLSWQERQGLNSLKSVSATEFASPIWRVLKSLTVSILQASGGANSHHHYPIYHHFDGYHHHHWTGFGGAPGNFTSVPEQLELLCQAGGFSDKIEALNGKKKDDRPREVKDREEEEKKRAVNRLVCEGLLKRVCEILEWLVLEKKMSLGENIEASFVQSIGFVTLFRSFKDPPPVAPLPFVLSLLAQVKEESSLFVKNQTINLSASPEEKKFHLEQKMLEKLENDASYSSDYEKFLVGVYQKFFKSKQDELDKKDTGDQVIHRNVDQREKGTQWICTQLGLLVDTLKKLGATGSGKAPSKTAPNKRNRDEKESDKDPSKAKAYTATKQQLFEKYCLIPASGTWRNAFAPEEVQPNAHKLFKACFAGDFEAVRGILDDGKVKTPLNLVNPLGMSLLAVTLLGSGAPELQTQICQEILDRSERLFVDLLKAKAEKAADPNTKKLDNYKLFAKHGGEEESDYEEDEEEEESEDEGDDDDADMASDVGAGKMTIPPCQILLHSQVIPFSFVETHLKKRNRKEWAEFLGSFLKKTYEKNRFWDCTFNVAALSVITGNHSAFKVFFSL